MKLYVSLFGLSVVFCLIATIMFIALGACSKDKSNTCSMQSNTALATCIISSVAFIAGEILRGGNS